MNRLDLPSLGLRVRHLPGPPLVSFRARLRGGVLNEKEPGLALLTGRMLAEGTRRRDWRRIVVDAENYGMYLQSFTSGESIGVSIDALAADADLLDTAERGEIDAAKSAVEKAIDGTDRDAINAAVEALDKATQVFAERRMDRGINQALSGMNVEQLAAKIG